jgi:hypothetical protein
MQEVQGERKFVIFQLLTKGICQPGKSAVAHTERQVLSFNKRGRNQIDVGLAADTPLSRSNTFWWGIPYFRAHRNSVLFNQHRIVNLALKSHVNGLQINRVPVSGQLDAIGQPFLQIEDENAGIIGVSFSKMPRRDEFGVGVNGNPNPSIAKPVLFLFIGCGAFLAADKRPNFVNLQSLAWQAAHNLVLILQTRLAGFNQDSGHGFLGNASHANGAANRTAFNQAANHFGPVLNAQFVHVNNVCLPAQAVN